MKKVISLLLVFVLIISLSCVFTSALDQAKTEVKVNKGDKVNYTLYLSDVDQGVVCGDYSIYFDPSVFDVEKYSKQPSGSVVNSKLSGEVRGNWVDLDGVNFKNATPVICVTLSSKKDANTNLNYYMRDLCTQNSKNVLVQIDKYNFTCSVDVNGSKVINNKPAELNIEEKQERGSFVNSASGSSKDKGINIYEGKSNVKLPAVNSNKTTNKSGEKIEKETKTANATEDKNLKASGEVNNKVDATSSNEQDLNTSDKETQSSGSPIYIWIIAIVVVLAIVGFVIYMIRKNKSKKDDNIDTNL